MRRFPLVLAAALLAVMLPLVPAGAADDPASTQAAREIAAARARANDAASAFEEASAALEVLAGEIQTILSSRDEAQRRLDVLSQAVREAAIRRYVHSSSGPLVILGDIEDYNASVRAAAVLRHVSVGQTDDIDAYQALQRDLAAVDVELAERQEAQRQAAAALESRSANLQSELGRLQRVEAARQAEVRRQREEAARRAAEEAARRAAAAAAARRAADAARQVSTGGGSGGTSTAPSGGTSTTPSGGSGSGTTTGSIVCPVAGAVAFGDTWGAARSGGRRHQGTDMMAARGTPVVAPVSGTVQLRSVRLGGLSFYVYGDDGHTYFGTHLNGYEGASGRRVSAGEVVGYVGNTGNASGGATHLHFEIKPNGGASVNPYRTVRAAC